MDLPKGADVFDVRPLILAGKEPFDAILTRWESVAKGGCLVIHAPFQPRPLIAHFSTRGIQAQPHSDGPNDHWLLLGPKP